MTDVSGFTFIKNGLTLGYPIKESVQSIEPLCDEVVINVGFDDPSCEKDDGTWEYLNSHFTHPKFKFIKSYWDPKLTKQGLILSQQTNIALDACSGKICQYIQGDEAVHEKDYSTIHDGHIQMLRDKTIEGLVFGYTHFYGNVDIVKHTRNIYRREVRAIRNGIGVKSHLDAQGFKINGTEKLKCTQIPASIYHYGWARQEQLMAKKTEAFEKLYHGQDHQVKEYSYDRIWGLKQFKGTHPKVMSEWIESNKNDIDFWSLPLRFEWKNIGLAISDAVEGMTGYRMGEYKNYRLL